MKFLSVILLTSTFLSLPGIHSQAMEDRSSVWEIVQEKRIKRMEEGGEHESTSPLLSQPLLSYFPAIDGPHDPCLIELNRRYQELCGAIHLKIQEPPFYFYPFREFIYELGNIFEDLLSLEDSGILSHETRIKFTENITKALLADNAILYSNVLHITYPRFLKKLLGKQPAPTPNPLAKAVADYLHYQPSPHGEIESMRLWFPYALNRLLTNLGFLNNEARKSNQLRYFHSYLSPFTTEQHNIPIDYKTPEPLLIVRNCDPDTCQKYLLTYPYPHSTSFLRWFFSKPFSSAYFAKKIDQKFDGNNFQTLLDIDLPENLPQPHDPFYAKARSKNDRKGRFISKIMEYCCIFGDEVNPTTGLTFTQHGIRKAQEIHQRFQELSENVLPSTLASSSIYGAYLLFLNGEIDNGLDLLEQGVRLQEKGVNLEDYCPLPLIVQSLNHFASSQSFSAYVLNLLWKWNEKINAPLLPALLHPSKERDKDEIMGEPFALNILGHMELVGYIFNFMPMESWGNMRLVCRAFKNTSDQPQGPFKDHVLRKFLPFYQEMRATLTDLKFPKRDEIYQRYLSQITHLISHNYQDDDNLALCPKALIEMMMYVFHHPYLVGHLGQSQDIYNQVYLPRNLWDFLSPFILQKYEAELRCPDQPWLLLNFLGTLVGKLKSLSPIYTEAVFDIKDIMDTLANDMAHQWPDHYGWNTFKQQPSFLGRF